MVVKIATVAVVGAGVAGMICAEYLSKHGFAVTVYDKGRHLGGRAASRDRDENTFDYGAQYFTARDPRFRHLVAQLLKQGNASRWNGKFANMAAGKLNDEPPSSPRYVGVPLMRSVVETIAKKIDCRTSHRVTSVARRDNKWTLIGTLQSESREYSFHHGGYDFLVLNLPPAQASFLHDRRELNVVQMRPCIALLLSFEDRVDLQFDGISMDDKLISWAARDSSKPGRPAGERWIIHASPEWSEDNLQTAEDEIENLLSQRFATTFDIELPHAHFAKIHKWRYALPSVTGSQNCIFDRETALAYCGDWCVSARIEGAFLSGLAAAEEIMRISPVDSF